MKRTLRYSVLALATVIAVTGVRGMVGAAFVKDPAPTIEAIQHLKVSNGSTPGAAPKLRLIARLRFSKPMSDNIARTEVKAWKTGSPGMPLVGKGQKTHGDPKVITALFDAPVRVGPDGLWIMDGTATFTFTINNTPGDSTSASLEAVSPIVEPIDLSPCQ